MTSTTTTRLAKASAVLAAVAALCAPVAQAGGSDAFGRYVANIERANPPRDASDRHLERRPQPRVPDAFERALRISRRGGR